MNADRFVDKLIERAARLRDLPTALRIVGRRKSTGTDVHKVVEWPYLIYYDVNVNAVTILTVRHGNRRQPHRFE